MGKQIVAIGFLALWATSPAAAFDGHSVKEDPLSLVIEEVGPVTQFDTPCAVSVVLENAAARPLEVELRLDDLVDEWRAVGESRKKVRIGARQKVKAMFQIAAGRGAPSALYPVHVYASFRHDGEERTAHAVRIFESNFEKAAVSASRPRELPVNTVPRAGTLPLMSLRTHRVTWQYYDKPLVTMPAGWRGSSSQSLASFAVAPVTRGATKRALVMHPPWRPGGGTIFAEYAVKLPRTRPITLKFANAIRDHTADEPPSDGVTFRVWVGDEVLFERHTDSKRWVDGQADLSDYAGRQILLRLESHPGPKRDTTCDSSYWGEPVIVAGRPPQPMPETARNKMRDAAARMVTSGSGSILRLDGGYRAAVLPADGGLSDAVLAIGNRDACVVFDGFRVSVLGHEIGAGLSAIATRGDATWDTAGQTVVMRQPLQLGNEEFELTARIRADKSGLRVKLDCPKRITDFAVGRFDQKAPRVYYGHGYCIVEPRAFRAGFGGHNLSTSHVGFDFEKGLSLLVACDHPPDYLEVNPADNTYALHTHLDATMTLVPSTEGVFDCARKYRPLYDKSAAPGLARKAGRFVFDIWGGRYAEIAGTMQKMIDYGLTDSLLTVHVWQRWGYDYRLPDIYPPLPSLGTPEDMRKIATLCAAHDIPWGLHDNYIDIYPDCKDYSYDHVCFTEQGQPVRAWLNEGRGAQSYRWRPDHIMPFVQRNLRLIKPNLRPTHYFIDVFTSIGCFDYYDKQGAFHSMLQTRRCWGETFAWIRDYLGDNAPMTSEAGHDQLIGYLDGADCQHLQLSPESKRFCIKLACADWERVPWYDAVLHDKFSLHGVGYSGRYQGGRSRQEHGIESDDYISAEMLEGHALMIDRGGFGRGAVRKYWLAQDFVRSIALDRIADVRFADGDIHRQTIDWQSGGQICVNRGSNDWRVADRVLPQYGYHARNGAIESSIERIDGRVVEQSRGPGHWYFNARGFGPEGQLAIRPEATEIEDLGGGRFKLIMNWQAHEPAPKDLQVFVHFISDKVRRRDRIAFQSGGRPSQGTSRWRGAVRLGDEWTAQIPSQYGPGAYEILVGLWDPRTGRRYGLLGDDDGTTRHRLGRLVAEGAEGRIDTVRLVKKAGPRERTARWNVERVPVDFGPAVTEGAFRCERDGTALVITPLPDLGPFSIALRPEKLGIPAARSIRSAHAVDAGGNKTRQLEYEHSDNVPRFRTQRGEFAYRIELAP